MATMPWKRRSVDPGPKVIRAAAQEVTIGDFQQAQRLALTRQKWQDRAWHYYHAVGEIHFAAQFVGNCLSRVTLVGAEIQDQTKEDESPDPVTTEDAKVKEAVANLQSERGGQPAFMRLLSMNIFIPGEAWLLGYEVDGQVVWEVLSTNELILQPGDSNVYRRATPNAPPDPIDKDALLIRVWQEDPQWSYLADSAMQTVLDECEKLIALTRADKAVSRSRFAGSGLLFIPNELVPPSQQPDNDSTDVDAAENPLFKQFTEAMIEPLKNEGHPSSVVPMVLFGPSEYGEKIKYLSFEREADKAAETRREQSIMRLAMAIDLPPEVLMGKADVNHWTAWQIKEETFQAHLEPLVQLICSALTHGYLQPALKRAGVKNPEKYCVWYDASKLITRPDQSESALKLYELNQLSGDAVRRVSGFDEDDEMNEEEYAKRIGVLLQVPELALTGKMPATNEPNVTERINEDVAVGPDGQPIQPVQPVQPNGAGNAPKTDSKANAANAKPGQAQSAKPGPQSNGKAPSGGKTPVTAAMNGHRRKAKQPIGVRLAQLDIDLMTRLRTSMDEVLAQALATAGNRVSNRAKKDTRYADIVTTTPREQLTERMGPALVASLNLTDDDLLKGSFAAYVAKVTPWFKKAQERRNELIAEYLTDEGRDIDADLLDDTYAERDRTARDFGIAALATGLLTLASKRLYDATADAPTTGEFDSISVPGDMVRRIVEAAGGTGSGMHVLGDTPNEEVIGGIGTGAVTRDILGDHGVRTAQYQWVYGPAIRNSFDGHLDLDGDEFSGWDDEVLAVQPGDEWLGTEFYHPGDHKGCLCSVAPLFDGLLTDFAPEEAITASSNGH